MAECFAYTAQQTQLAYENLLNGLDQRKGSFVPIFLLSFSTIIIGVLQAFLNCELVVHIQANIIRAHMTKDGEKTCEQA